MIVAFDTSKQLLVFTAETIPEQSSFSTFPGLQNIGVHKVCPAISPIAYSIIARLQNKVKNLKLMPDVQAWLDEPFKLKVLPESFKYYTPPMDFQDIALRYLYTLGSAGLLLDPGLGKSKIVLDYIYLMGFKKVCLVCPLPLMFVWVDEIAKHRPELSYYCVETTDWEKEKPGIDAAQVTIINYNKVVTFKHQLKASNFEFINLDEFLIKNNSTARTQAISELGRVIPYRAGGSGTLINNTPMDAFCPIRFLQPALVGGNYYNFQKLYTVEREMKRPDGSTMKQIVAFKGHAEVRSILESCCIVMTKDEWLKLPPKVFTDVTVQLSVKQREAYYSLLSNYRVEALGVELEVDNPLAMLSKLYQISNGFIYSNEETEEEIQDELLSLTPKKSPKRITSFFPEQPKIVALRELLIGKLKDRKVVLWFNMQAEFLLIETLLKELGISYLSIQGGDTKIGQKVRAFNTTPSIMILVAQAKSINYGVTLMGSKKKDLEDLGIEVLPGLDPAVYTQIFLSLSFSLEVYLQQIDRIHRLGCTHTCEYYRIFANTPVDRKLKEALESKMSLRKEMLVDIAISTLENNEI